MAPPAHPDRVASSPQGQPADQGNLLACWHADDAPIDWESAKQLRSFVELAPTALAMFDRQLCYVSASRRWQEEYLGRVYDELTGRAHSDLFSTASDHWHEAVARGLAGTSITVPEDLWTLPDSRQTWVQYEVRPWSNITGEIGGIAVFAQDVSQRKQQEEILQRNKELLDCSQEIAHLGSWEFDLQRNIFTASDETYRIFGLSPQGTVVTFDGFRAMVHPDDLAAVDDSYFGTIRSNVDSFEKEYRIIRVDSQAVRFVHVKCNHVRDESGEITGSVGFIHDITERKSLEANQRKIQERLEQTQRLQSLGVLAGGIAHDFNNLMMGVLGHSELLLEELPLHAPAVKNVKAIKSASLQAADLCRQLLAYAGQGKAEEVDFSLSLLVKEMQEMLKTCISKNCQLVLKLQPELPNIKGDPSQIRQILMNFVINASEAIGNHEGVITVSSRAVCSPAVCSPAKAGHGMADSIHVLEPANGGPCVVLEVSDSGCGMDAATLTRVFEPFFSTKFKGRGLGLSAVIGILRAHGGGLSVRSALGKGSTFRAAFPLAIEPPPLAPHADPAAAATAWRGSGTILLVDDEEIVRNATSQLLAVLGFNVITAVDGLDALQIYRTQHQQIDLILLDLTMPRMGGEETLREIKKLNAAAQVVVVSGYSESCVPSLFAGQEIAGCLHKPFTLAVLRDALFKIMGPPA